MIEPQMRTRRALAPLVCLVLAFQLTTCQQQGEHPADGQGAALAAQTGPMMSLGSESSAALESSAAMAGDDLIAAESSQTPDAAIEHKSFTPGIMPASMRQEQMQAASVAPVYAPQQQQQHHQPAPQQANGGQHPMFSVHPQHMQHPALRMAAHPQAKSFNPFMAAALAGNYGPAQQQIAAAAAASLQRAQQQQQQQVAPQPMPHHAHHSAAPMQHPHQQAAVSHAAPQQQVVHAAPGRQPIAAQQQVAPSNEGQQLAVQESSVRQNVLPAPSFSVLDSNNIEMGGESGGERPQASGQQQSMAAASSAQHPVVAVASGGSSMQEAGANAWPLQAPDIPKIVNLEVKCEKNLMKVSIEFDKVFNGVIFSKGHYNQGQCLHVGQNSGKQQAYFDISINSCGTQGNTQNGLYGMGGNTGSGTYFENTIVVQYDPNVQEVYDHARKLRCTWHDQYEKAVTFRPFPVDMLDIVRADFAGDNVGCWMQIQVGKGPWASEVAGIVKIGQTMTMVLAIKDEENKFDMLVRNCFAHDGKRGPIELVDKSGCITRPKLMSRFTKIKNFGSSATVLSYAHFQAFKFPDSMEVHFQCTIQICRHQCPEQCSSSSQSAIGGAPGETYSESTISGTFNIHGRDSAAAAAAASAGGSDSVHLRKFGSSASASLTRERRQAEWAPSTNGSHHGHHFRVKPMTQTVGLNRVIQVVSTGDLAFAIQQQQQQRNEQLVNGSFGDLADSSASQLSSSRLDLSNQICMSSYSFVLGLLALALVLLCSTLVAISLYLRHKTLAKHSSKLINCGSSSASSTCSSPVSTMQRSQQHLQVPRSQQQQQMYNNSTSNNNRHNLLVYEQH